MPAETVQTVLHVGSSDVTSMMVQTHLDQLRSEEAAIKAEHQADKDAVLDFAKEIVSLFEASFAAKRKKVDPLVDAINAFLPKRAHIRAALDPRTADPEHWANMLFYQCYSRRNAQVAPLEKGPLQGSWTFFDKVEAEEDDRGLSTFNISDLSEIRHLSVKVPDALRTRIDETFKRLAANQHKLQTVQSELANIPDLERKVSAALTRQLLTANPELLQQINAALVTAGGKHLIEVQEKLP